MSGGRRGRALRWLVERRVVLAAGLIAAIPVLVSTVNAVRAGWIPVFDDATIAGDAFDALSSHGRLVGVYSDASLPQVGAVFNAGPLLFWLLALPARLLGGWALAVTAGLVNTASVVGVVALARRRGGPILMFSTAVALLLLCRSVPAETLHDILNPSIALLPFVGLLFLAWSIACGEYRLLPVAILVGSFVLQSHASLAVPALPVLVLGVGGLALTMWRDRASSASCGENRRRWLLVALGVFVACWAAPVIDQLKNTPGNFSRIIETATTGEKTLGLTDGWHALVRATGIPPWWTSKSQSGEARFFDLFGKPGAFAIASCAVILGGLTVTGVLGLRRRRPDVVAVSALALALSAVVVAGVASTPARLAIFASKATQTAQAAGMFSWVALGFSVIVLARPARSRRVETLVAAARSGRRVLVTALALCGALILAVLVSSNQEPDLFQSIYRPLHALSARLDGRIPRSGSLQVVSAERTSALRAGALATGLVYELRRQGYHPVMPDVSAFVEKFGSYYSARRYPPANELVFDDSYAPTQPGARVLGRAMPTHVASPPYPERPITLSIVGVRACPPATPPPSRPVTSLRGLHLVHRGMEGFVDRSATLGASAELCGWAVSTIDHRAVDQIVVLSHGRFVASARPAAPRPDLAHVPAAAGVQNPGYSLEVPRGLVARGPIRVFAVTGSEAMELPYVCRKGIRDVGC